MSHYFNLCGLSTRPTALCLLMWIFFTTNSLAVDPQLEFERLNGRTGIVDIVNAGGLHNNTGGDL